MDERLLLDSERAGLTMFLDAQREGLLRKLDSLDDQHARLTPTASNLSLLGLLKHAATWERRWFGVIVAGQTAPDDWPRTRPEPRDKDLFAAPDDTVERWLSEYRDACEASRSIVAARDLDSRCARTDIIDCNLRYVLLHMIEETARHAGHADIIRESVDGARGI